jgi:histidine triad (HIT) family protein
VAECILCQIVIGEAPSHMIWQDDKHVAFLSTFLNTEDTTVVIPKEHHTSYAFDLPVKDPVC